MTRLDIDAATQFIAANARIVDRRRFDRMFAGGPAEPIRDALAAYRNEDGGFGHALEPDGRTPGSQPAAAETAFRIMDEADAWDEELVAGACDWLAGVAPQEGGVTFVLPSVEGWPHAPWWVPDEGLPASLIFTGLIAGTLHAREVDHPWLDRATELMWRRIDDFEAGHPYEVRGVLAFLQHAPDRDRAEAVVEKRLAPLLGRAEYVAFDPGAEGEVHGPLDYAPRPDSLARRLFDEETIERHLDHFAASQREDGSWTFNWLRWSPAAEREWDGFLTVHALALLRDNGRIQAAV
jgi:hypothetical protein